MADEQNPTNSPEGDETSTVGEAGEPMSRRAKRSRSSGGVAATQAVKQRFFTLIPANTNFDFVGRQKTGVVISVIAILMTFAMLIFNQVRTGSALNYGIDFQGGSSVRLALSEPVDIEELRGVLEEKGYAGSSVVSVPDADNEVMIRVKEVLSISDEDLAGCQAALEAGLPPGVGLLEGGFVHPAESSKIFMKFSGQPTHGDIERLLGHAGCSGTASAGVGKPEEFPVEYALIGVGNDIVQVVDEHFGAGTVDEIVTSETVGAKVGNQLKLDGVKATLIAIGFIFLYVLLRFDLRYAPGGIVALAHDALIMVGAYAVTGREFNLQAIAAILTIVGYSINDTIVVFDRIRERVALFRDDPIGKTVNLSLNETLSRTILTSGTTLLVVLCTLFIGSGAIKDFAFALTVGLVAGTYSSIFVASPIFLWLNDKIYKGKGHLLEVEEPSAGTGKLLGEEGQPPEAEGEGELELPAIDTTARKSEDADEPEADEGDEPGGDQRKSRRRRRRPPA
ncbi:protein translocase subunit SecF [Nannocystaceae bacterium ST9]